MTDNTELLIKLIGAIAAIVGVIFDRTDIIISSILFFIWSEIYGLRKEVNK